MFEPPFEVPTEVPTIATRYGGQNAGLQAPARARQGRNGSGGRQRRCGAARTRQDLKAGEVASHAHHRAILLQPDTTTIARIIGGASEALAELGRPHRPMLSPPSPCQ
ncbi:hypothetical protein thsrh120_52820 [Rhizobium sp. No.120]